MAESQKMTDEEFQSLVKHNEDLAAVDDQVIDELLRSLGPPPNYIPSVDPNVVKNTAIPQTSAKFDDPFERAYTPQLAAYDISQKDWLAFQDALNIALIGSPPLRVVDLVGTVVGFVPNEWCMIAGIVVNVAAQTAIHVISKTLSERLLRKFNESYFAPRGLVVRIMTSEALKVVVGAAAEEEKKGKFKKGLSKFGNGVGDAVLFSPIALPFSTRIVKAIRGAPSPDEASGNTVKDRRVAPLQPFISPLDFNVPPVEKTDGPMDKMSGWALKLRNWQQKNEEHKATHLREGVASGYATKTMLITRREKHMPMRIARRRLDKANMREERRSVRCLWLVVLTTEQDQAIKDRKLADDPNLNVEQIPAAEWDAEVKAEEAKYEQESPEYEEYEGEKHSEAGLSKH